MLGPLHSRILAALLKSIHRERKGERIESLILQHTIKSFGRDLLNHKHYNPSNHVKLVKMQ